MRIHGRTQQRPADLLLAEEPAREPLPVHAYDCALIGNCQGKTRVYQVLRVYSIGIKRHIKVRADANPYMPEHARYFWQRWGKKGARLLGALSARQLRAQAA